ncbi:MAG: GntR family transcriptional regulator, partial [Geminicoccaceae bacterium]|nr:GntR family transcriptional regulator [Geminicoccaceae bacterium]
MRSLAAKASAARGQSARRAAAIARQSATSGSAERRGSSSSRSPAASRSERIVSQIKSLILEGRLRPGDKLPPERELAELMNVSRTSVREAIKTLAAMGLVVI